jgi:predicted DNA-binding transcriptional regulator AlpA
MYPKTILNSWKEIAQYVGRSERTIQRWEKELAFPIHRPRGQHRGAVLALPEEIDEWARMTPSSAPPETTKVQQADRAAAWVRAQQRLAELRQGGETVGESRPEGLRIRPPRMRRGA